MPSSRSDHVPAGTIPTDATPEFDPIFGKVVIRVEEEPERKYGRLYLPQRDKERTTIGVVHAVYAPEQTTDGLVESQVKVGDTVVFGQFTGTALNIGRQLFIVCKEHDLLTVVRFPDDTEQLPEISEAL